MGWYSREGRFLITRRVDQPFSLVLALPLFPPSSIRSFSIYFLFPLCLSCIVSVSSVKLSFFLYLSLCNLRRWNFFSFCLSLYCLRRWSDISSFFISFVWSLSLKSWTVYTLLSPRSSYSICFISFSHLAIGIRPGSANPSLLASFSRNQPASLIASFSFPNSMQLALLSENGIELHLCSCPFSCDMTVSLLTRQGQPTPLHRFILVHLSRSLFHCVSIVLFSFLSVASSSCAIPTNASRCRIWFYSVCVRYPGTSLPSTSRSAYRPSFALPLDRM